MASKARGLADLGNAFNDGALSNRNLIINGAMQVAQRGTSETGITGEKYSVLDRFRLAFGTLGTWTGSQDSSAPDDFSSSLKILCTVADASPASGDYAVLQARIEAQDLQKLSYGASSAKTMTLSFWVKSNKTGTASLDVIQHDNGYKSIYPSYTINSADTWEYKTVQIAADTAGVINNDSGIGIEISWWLNSGSSLTGGSHTASWGTQVSANRNASNLGVGGAVNDYFAITGVQLEVGDTATPFEHRSYGQELALCQRYYYRRSSNSTDDGIMNMNAYSINACYGVLPLPVMMRSSPTLSYNEAGSSFRYYGNNSAQYISTAGLSIANASPNSVEMLAVPSTSASQGSGGWLRFQHASQWIAYDAEL